MRITVRQLRQLIREQVEEAMHPARREELKHLEKTKSTLSPAKVARKLLNKLNNYEYPGDDRYDETYFEILQGAENMDGDKFNVPYFLSLRSEWDNAMEEDDTITADDRAEEMRIMLLDLIPPRRPAKWDR